jgi:MFS family permease
MVGAGVVGLLLIDSTPKAFIWAIYMGLVQGGGFTLNQVLFADYFGRDSLGAIRGIIAPIQLAANAMGPLAAAYAYDVLGNYFIIFLVFGLLRLFSAILVFMAKQPNKSSIVLK